SSVPLGLFLRFLADSGYLLRLAGQRGFLAVEALELADGYLMLLAVDGHGHQGVVGGDLGGLLLVLLGFLLAVFVRSLFFRVLSFLLGLFGLGLVAGVIRVIRVQIDRSLGSVVLGRGLFTVRLGYAVAVLPAVHEGGGGVVNAEGTTGLGRSIRGVRGDSLVMLKQNC